MRSFGSTVHHLWISMLSRWMDPLHDNALEKNLQIVSFQPVGTKEILLRQHGTIFILQGQKQICSTVAMILFWQVTWGWRWFFTHFSNPWEMKRQIDQTRYCLHAIHKNLKLQHTKRTHAQIKPISGREDKKHLLWVNLWIKNELNMRFHQVLSIYHQLLTKKYQQLITHPQWLIHGDFPPSLISKGGSCHLNLCDTMRQLLWFRSRVNFCSKSRAMAKTWSLPWSFFPGLSKQEMCWRVQVQKQCLRWRLISRMSLSGKKNSSDNWTNWMYGKRKRSYSVVEKHSNHSFGLGHVFSMGLIQQITNRVLTVINMDWVKQTYPEGTNGKVPRGFNLKMKLI